MSDTSQGEGWWQASDGRWYPPEQHPDAVAPQPAEQTPTPTPTSTPTPTPEPAADAVPGPSAAADTGSGQSAAAAAAQLRGSSPVHDQPPMADGSGGAGTPPPTQETTGGGGSRRGILVAALVVVVALLAAGVAFVVLGDDDDDEVASEESAAEKNGGDTAEFCGRMEAMVDEDLMFDFDQVEAFDELAAVAPLEIRDDMVLVVGAMRQLVAEIEQAEDEGDHDGAMIAVFAAIFDAEFEEASDRIEVFLEVECGIEPFADPEQVESPDIDDATVMGVAMSELEAHFEDLTAQMGLDADYISRVGTDRLSQVIVTIGGGDDADAVDDLVAVCDGLSEFLADHPDADGTARIEVMRSMSTLQAVNEDVVVGDAGDCTAGVNQPPGGDAFWDDQAIMGVPMLEVEAYFDVLLDEHGLSWAGFGTFDDGLPQLELGVFLVGRDDDVVDDVLALCDDMSAFLADHPDAEGSAGIQVGDDVGFFGDVEPTGLLVANDEVEPGEAGTCEQQ